MGDQTRRHIPQHICADVTRVIDRLRRRWAVEATARVSGASQEIPRRIRGRQACRAVRRRFDRPCQERATAVARRRIRVARMGPPADRVAPKSPLTIAVARATHATQPHGSHDLLRVTPRRGLALTLGGSDRAASAGRVRGAAFGAGWPGRAVRIRTRFFSWRRWEGAARRSDSRSLRT